jgi:ERCC4-type nuclease
MIVVDSREPASIVKSLKEDLPDFQFDTLVYGDYLIIGEDVKYVIERKSVLDLFNSITDGRLWDQLKGIEKYQGFHKILLIEGNIAQAMHINSKITFPRWVGVKTTVVKAWGDVSIIQTSSQSETVLFLKSLDKKVEQPVEKVVVSSYNISKNGRTLDQEAVDVLSAFGKIGGEKAHSLLKYFHTLNGVFNAKPTKIEELVGAAVSKHFIEVLHHKYEK